MNLIPKTVFFQVCQSGLVLKYRDTITCHGEICFHFGSAPRGVLLIPLSPLLSKCPNAYS